MPRKSKSSKKRKSGKKQKTKSTKPMNVPPTNEIAKTDDKGAAASIPIHDSDFETSEMSKSGFYLYDGTRKKNAIYSSGSSDSELSSIYDDYFSQELSNLVESCSNEQDSNSFEEVCDGSNFAEPPLSSSLIESPLRSYPIDQEATLKSFEACAKPNSVESPLSSRSIESPLRSGRLEREATLKSNEVRARSNSVESPLRSLSIEQEATPKSIEAGVKWMSFESPFSSFSIEQEATTKSIEVGVRSSSIASPFRSYSIEQESTPKSIEVGVRSSSVESPLRSDSMDREATFEACVRSLSVEPPMSSCLINSPLRRIYSVQSFRAETEHETLEMLLSHFIVSRRPYFLILNKKAKKLIFKMEVLNLDRIKKCSVVYRNNRWKQRDAVDWFALQRLWDIALENLKTFKILLQYVYDFDSDIDTNFSVKLEEFYDFVQDLLDVAKSIDKLLKVSINCYSKFSRFVSSHNESVYLQKVSVYRPETLHFYKMLKVEVDKFTALWDVTTFSYK